jgi:hypothetical protein
VPKLVGIMERTDLRVWDVCHADGALELVHNPIRSAGETQLFGQTAPYDRLCNAPSPVGLIPHDESWRVNGVGLGLNFSDRGLFELAFRYLEFVLFAAGRDIYTFRAQQFLDGMIAEEHDPEPGFGFAWSQRLGRSLSLATQQPYGVRLIVPQPLAGPLQVAQEHIDHRDGQAAGWFAEIRIYLLGVRTRRIDTDERTRQ